MKTHILLLGLLAFCFLANSYFDSYYSTQAYYAVMFDERGLASAALRLDYVNTEAGPVDHIDLLIPGDDVKVVSAFVKSACEPKNTSYPYYYYDECYSGYKFVPASVSSLGGGSYRISLNESIPSGKSTSVLVFYRALGYVKDDIFGKKFDFETVKYDFDVEGTRVAIDVDEDLVLKEGGSEGNYNSMKSAVMAGTTAGSASSQGLQAALSSSYMYVGYAPGYVREKSTLLAGETFTMSGTYGRGWLQLHLTEIAIMLLVFGAVGLFIRKKAQEAAKAKAEKAAEESKAGVKGEPKAKASGLGDAAVFAFSCAVGFALVLSLAVLAIIWSTARIDEPGVLVLGGLLAWVSTAAYIYIQKSRDGNGLAAAMMFVGFSVIVTPFMLIMALWIWAMVGYHPAYYY